MLPSDTRESTSHAGWTDDHEEGDTDTVSLAAESLWERPHRRTSTRFVPRIGVMGPSHVLNEAFIVALVQWLTAANRTSLIITLGDATESRDVADRLQRTLAGIVDGTNVVAISIGRQWNVAATNAVASELTTRVVGVDALLFVGHEVTESVIWDPTLVHYRISVHEGAYPPVSSSQLAASADLSVIHYPDGIHRNVETTAQRSRCVTPGSPPMIADCLRGGGLDAVFAVLWDEVLC